MPQQPRELSIRETYAGKSVFLTGASGFVGKVWLAMALERVPEIDRIYVLIRGKGRSARERFERIVGTSMVFKSLHERLGPEMSKFVSERVEVVEGDVSEPDFGMNPEVADRLRRDVDLIVNCAGLVDFNPDVRDAVSANIDGAVYAARFAASCDHAALLHVSTCYVAGRQDGRIPEEVVTDRTPNGKPLDAAAELEHLHALIEDVHRENESEKTENLLRGDVVKRIRDRGLGENEARIKEMVTRLKRKRLREVMAQAGMDRARALGWPNTYTYTKALAELLLMPLRDEVPVAILRPAIVESAIEFPFPGWNEGFNTSGPLVYLTGTWFRHIPAKESNPLDVIPVDEICKALFTVGAAVMRREHEPVYQCGSSDRNTMTLGRLTELSALAHRKHLREHGVSKLEKLVLSRWDALTSEPEHVLNVGNIRRAVGQVTRYLRHGLPEKIPSELRSWADDVAKTGDSMTRKLRQIEDVVDLFLPFTYENYIVFEARAIDKHRPVEPEFRFAPENISWRSYWLNIHLPGLRKWCFPSYENKEIEQYRPAEPFRLLESRTASAEQYTATSAVQEVR